MKIDINTKFVTLIGTPLSQSFAARMQNSAYETMGLNLHYFYTEADDSHLKQIIDGIRYMPSFIGAAITKPNKVRVMEYLDEIDPLCAKIGACNTIVKKDGKLIGYNTDASGFLASIKEDITKHAFFCFGAGGAGHAICSILADHSIKKIYISDLYEKSAIDLTNKINREISDVAEYVPYRDYSKIQKSTFIINASGIGMGKTINETPLPEEYILKGQYYFDACYNPSKTRFLINAEKKGCQIQNGLDMSLYQGAEQIKLWSNRNAPVEEMRKQLLQILEETRG